MKYVAIPMCVLLALSSDLHGQEPQVMMTVRVAEFSLTKLRSAGIDVSAIIGDQSDKRSRVENANGAVDGDLALWKLEELDKQRLVHVLAKADLAAANGQKVTYRSGGELPIRKMRGNGGEEISSQPGTLIELTPTLKDNNTILLKFDWSSNLAANALQEVPTQTELLRSGQTLRILGPTQIRHEAHNVGLPVLGEIPYVGAIFRTQKEVRNEIATVTLVRVEILKQPSPTAQRTADTSAAGARR